MPKLTSIAVFCGSNMGSSPDYRAAAVELGEAIARRGLALVYGGTHMGLMGVVADAALAAGGTVVGVITHRLHGKGHLHPRLSRHELVADMRARKARMSDMADAFVALPGGLGTLEELFEAATLTQLGEHVKPCGALDVRGFYRPLHAMLHHAVQEGFMKPQHRDMLVLEANPDHLLDRLSTWEPPTVEKWIQPQDPLAAAPASAAGEGR